jgi:hypothetical protein
LQHGQANSPRDESRADRKSFSDAIFPKRRGALNAYLGVGGRSRVISELTEGIEELLRTRLLAISKFIVEAIDKI